MHGSPRKRLGASANSAWPPHQGHLSEIQDHEDLKSQIRLQTKACLSKRRALRAPDRGSPWESDRETCLSFDRLPKTRTANGSEQTFQQTQLRCSSGASWARSRHRDSFMSRPPESAEAPLVRRMLLRTHRPPSRPLNKFSFTILAERFTMHSSLTSSNGQCVAQSPTLTSDEHRRRV